MLLDIQVELKEQQQIIGLDNECPERSRGSSELFNENDVTSSNERIPLLKSLIFKDL